MISAIVSAIGNAEALLKSLWDSYNSAPMVQAKVAQMTQEDKDAHNVLLEKAMHGTADERAKATADLQKLLSE
jgi:hypothetical protein